MALPIHITRGLERFATAHRLKVITKTVDHPLDIRDTGAFCTNLGAEDTVVFSLPAGAETGDSYTFFVAAAEELRVDPPSTHQLITSGSVQTAGKYISADDEGESIRVTYLGSAKWGVEIVSGTWSVESE